MNRLSLMVLALTMSSPTLLAGVVENYDFKENHTGYTLYFKQINTDEARLMQLNIDNYDTEIVIPSVVKDTYGYEFKVTAIGQLYKTNYKDIDFSYMGQCTSIFGNVSDCPNYIKSLTIPESVKTIWPSAFSGSNLNNGYKYGLGCKSLTIPGNVTEIGAGAFKYAKFEQVAIPNAAKNIYRETFDHCVNLKSINLGNGVIEIWDDAFRDIANNAEIHIDAVTPPKISDHAFSSGYTAKVFVPYGTSEDYRSKWSTFSELTFVEMEPGQTSGVTVGKAPAELHVECNHSNLYATAASVIRIYSISGTLVHSGSGVVNVSLPAGVYLVKSGTDVVKILVQ